MQNKRIAGVFFLLIFFLPAVASADIEFVPFETEVRESFPDFPMSIERAVNNVRHIFFWPGPQKGKEILLASGHTPALSSKGDFVAFYRDVALPREAKTQLVLRQTTPKATEKILQEGHLAAVVPPIWINGDKEILFGILEGYDIAVKKTSLAGGEAVKIFQQSTMYGATYNRKYATISAQDLENYKEFALNGELKRTLPLEKITGEPQALRSSNQVAPSPGNPGLLAYTRMVDGTALFHKYIPDISSALFLYDLASGERKRITPEEMTVGVFRWADDGKAIFLGAFLDKDAGKKESERDYVYKISIPEGKLERLVLGRSPGR